MILSHKPVPFLIALCVLANSCFARVAWADRHTSFDVPATVEGCDVSGPDYQFQYPGQRLIQIEVPCSVRIQCDADRVVDELAIEVQGLFPGFEVIGYAPNTQMATDIEGLVAVEDKKEKNHGLAIDVGGRLDGFSALNATAKMGDHSSLLQRYSQMPEQQLLSTSGTMKRGAGVFYKFRQNSQTTLEGTHRLVLTVRLPVTWRGGLIRVDCRASGAKQSLIGGEESYVAGGQAFVVAVYLKGDGDAKRLASQYASIERQMRDIAGQWERFQADQNAKEPFSSFAKLFQKDEKGLPKNWSNQFMLYDAKSLQDQIRPHLSESLQQAADQFLEARHRVLRLTQ